METYMLSKRELFEKLNAGEGGLTRAEAAARLAKNGRNALKAEKKHSLIGLFFAQFRDLMTIILICAACLSAVLAYITREQSELIDTGILLFIILLNAVVGFLQQYRADAAIEKLKKLSAETAKVVRDGRVFVVDAAELVIGDVVEIGEGDRIPADCRVLESESFRLDESALTGESKPVTKRDCTVKSGVLAERENTVHFSTFCVSGRARCMVTATGMDTEMGAISRLMDEAKSVPSPLDKIVEKLGKIISVTVIGVAGVLFLCGLLAGRVGFLDNLMRAIAVAVAAIPEGMGAVVTVILAVGVQRMSARRAVMRKLSSVETLGSCSCICSDKTGTLTENKMTAADVFFSGSEAALLRCMRVCNTVKGSAGSYLGDPTEIALVEYADRKNFHVEFQPLGGIPFSSERKMMSVSARIGKESRLFVKGGADVLLKKCSYVLTETGVAALDGEKRREIGERIAAYSAEAMRVLAFAEGEYGGSVREEELTFLGLAALFDPPRAGVKEAALSCRRAGIRTVMITGDGADTAFEIARRLGIARRREEVLSGEELDGMGEAALSERLAEVCVFARVTPAHKLRIVRAFQARGEVVAMTGDGVNDAPSVRAADIGVAMGSGTDVTKNAADMVIADDDFSTMVGAVEEGRNVFFNVKRTISFFLSTNLAEVLAVLIATLFLWRYEFLSSTQLLWINLITDSLPVLALGVEKGGGAMEKPPVSANEIFSFPSMLFILLFGGLQTALVLAVFCIALALWGNGAATTCAFLVMSFLELFHAFNVRKERRIRVREFFSNPTLLVTVFVGVLLNALLVFVPLLRTFFALTPLSAGAWGLVAGASLLILPLGELYKALAAGLPVRGGAKRTAPKRRRIGIRSRGNIQ